MIRALGARRRGPEVRKPSRKARPCIETMESRLNPADVQPTLAGATALGIVGAAAVSFAESVDVPTDVDMYKFTVAAGQRVGFDIDTPINGPPGLGSYLRLFDASGRELASNNDRLAPGDPAPGAGSGSDGFDSYIDYGFASGGVYYVGVSNWQHRSYNPTTGAPSLGSDPQWLTGPYTLVLKQTAPPDPDDQIIEARNLGVVGQAPIVRSDAISVPSDVDMYKFTVTAGQRLGLDVDTPANGPGGLGAYLRLFNASGVQLASNNDGVAPDDPLRPASSPVGFDSYIEYTFAQAGTYYVAVSNWQNTNYNATTGVDNVGSSPSYLTGAYSLTVRDYTYFVSKVPAIMGHLGWTHAQRLQQLWFGAPARRAGVDPLPSDASTVTMDWVLGYARTKAAYDDAVQSYANDAAKAVLKGRLQAAFAASGAQTVGFGDFSRTGAALHAQYTNFRSVTDTKLDDLGGTLGKFNFYVVPRGTATRTAGGGISVTVTDVGVYVRDSFDFEGFQFLGIWATPSYVSDINIFGGTAVFNSDYAAYRTATRLGGDFIVYSNLKITHFAQPVTFVM